MAIQNAHSTALTAVLRRTNQAKGEAPQRRSVAMLRALSNPIEQLEERVLLSVTASMLAGPIDTPGAEWTYAVNSGQGQTATLTRQVIGPATFNGHSATELDTSSSLQTSGNQGQAKDYHGMDPAGDYVGYGNVTANANRTVTTTYTPYQGGFPAVAVAGTPYMNSDVEMTTTAIVGGTPGTDTFNETENITLVSETLVPIKVPAGTYQCYELNQVLSSTQVIDGVPSTTTSTDTTTDYVAPGVGQIEILLQGGGSYMLTNFRNVNDHLAFIQNPNNAAAGDIIKPPVTVQVQDPAGAVETNATGSVTLSLNTFSGTGTLSGILTEPVVGGTATFSNLSITASGEYTLTAADSAATPIAPSNSSSFKISDTKLAFTIAPSDGLAGEPISPAIVVSLEDGMNNVVTTDNTTVVQLNPVGFTSANPIAGNTATLVNGQATFSKVVLTKAGVYRLQATDGTDAVATSDKFKMTGDKLKFLIQPKSGDINTPIPLSVEILNRLGKLDTTVSTTLVLNLLTIKGGLGASFLGTTALTFSGGKAVFTATNGPIIDTAGTYQLTATEEDYSSGPLAPTYTTTAITSNPFAVAGLHLKVLTPPPATVDVAAPFTMTIKIVDPKGKLFNENTAQCVLSLQIITDGVGAQLKGTTAVTFSGGIARFTIANGLLINSPGTFAITASEKSSNPATPVDTRSFKVLGYKLDGAFPSKTNAANDDLRTGGRFAVFDIVDPRGKVVLGSAVYSPDEFPDVQVTLTPVSGSGTLVDNTPVQPKVTIPVPDLSYDIAFDITKVGMYMARVSAIDTPGSVVSYTAIAGTKPELVEVVNHTVVILHSVPVVQNDNFATVSHAVGVPYDESGNPGYVGLNDSAGYEVTLNSISGDGNLLPEPDSGNPSYAVDAHTVVFPAGNFSDADMVIDTPGRYTLTVTEVITPAGLPFDLSDFAPEASTTPFTTKPFLVLSDKLAFVEQPPAKLAINQMFQVQVAIQDNHGNTLNDFSPGTDPDFTAGALLTILARISRGGLTSLQNADTPVNFVNGVATFSNLYFNASGFFSLNAAEENNYPGQGSNYVESPVPTVAKSTLIRVLKAT